jgi:O-antigen ligase
MFLLIPLFCFPLFNSQYFNGRKELFIKSFIIGILIICVFEFLRAVTGWEIGTSTTPDISFDPDSYTSPFRSQKLSFLEHPTYLSMKVLFAVSIVVIAYRELRFSMLVSLMLLFGFILYIYCLSSRTIYLALIILSIYLIFTYLKRYRLHLLMLVLGPLILYTSYEVSRHNPRVINKIELIKKRYLVDKLKFKDLDPRFTSWLTSADLIKKNPVFGVGLNSRDILAEEYLKNGYNNEANLRLNSHNQFLETQLALGIPGSLVLLWMLFAPLFRKRELWKPELYFSFLIILITAFMFESVLVRQWGIMFYTIFYCFQVNMKPAEKKRSDNRM